MPKKYNYTMKTGRPSKYDDAFVGIIEKYLESCGSEQHKLPKKEDIALLLSVDEDTLNNWKNEVNEDGSKRHPELFSALTRVMTMQKAQLMDASFYGGKEVNGRVGQFLLSANHGMKERTDVTSDDEKIEGVLIYKPEKNSQ